MNPVHIQKCTSYTMLCTFLLLGNNVHISSFLSTSGGGEGRPKVWLGVTFSVFDVKLYPSITVIQMAGYQGWDYNPGSFITVSNASNYAHEMFWWDGDGSIRQLIKSFILLIMVAKQHPSFHKCTWQKQHPTTVPFLFCCMHLLPFYTPVVIFLIGNFLNCFHLQLLQAPCTVGLLPSFFGSFRT